LANRPWHLLAPSFRPSHRRLPPLWLFSNFPNS